jgi:hypothetical protein
VSHFDKLVGITDDREYEKYLDEHPEILKDDRLFRKIRIHREIGVSESIAESLINAENQALNDWKNAYYLRFGDYGNISEDLHNKIWNLLQVQAKSGSVTGVKHLCPLCFENPASCNCPPEMSKEQAVELLRAKIKDQFKPPNRLKRAASRAYNCIWNLIANKHKFCDNSVPQRYPNRTERDQKSELKAHRYQAIFILLVIVSIAIILTVLR